MAADAPLDRIPLYVREGAILPKIPDDVMTLVPPGEYKDQAVKSLDDRRVYEIYPGAKLEAIQDFEGPSIQTGDQPDSVAITGQPAHVILRWRFARPRTAEVNGKTVPPVRTADGVTIEFDHADKTTVIWR